MVTHDEFEAYLKDLLMNEGFPDGILAFHLASDPDKTEGEEMNDEEYMSHMLSRQNISDYGLAFLFDINKDLVISREFIEIFYRTVVKIARTKPKPLAELPEAPVPAEGAEVPEEAKHKYDKEVEQANHANVEINAQNEQLAKLQAKMKIATRQKISDNESCPEGALIKLNNHREVRPEEANISHVSGPEDAAKAGE